MPKTVDELIEQAGGTRWTEHPGHPLEDWKAEVANDETRLGYWEWAAKRTEFEDGEE